MAELTHIQTYFNKTEAEYEKNFLSAHGVEAMISDDDAGGMFPQMDATEGVHLWVNPEKAEEARRLLKIENS